MERTKATEIANTWSELLGREHPLRDEYQRLVHCLASLLPTDTDAAAGALIDGAFAVLAIAGDGLLVVIFEQTDEDTHAPVVERLPRTPLVVSLRIREHYGKALSGR